jgi:3-phenylpropionate/cinnamic acid dioxygenase small subunit
MRQSFNGTIMSALVAMAFVAGSDARAQAPNIEARLRNLESEAEIRRLLDDYMTLLDSRDWDAYVQLFATDGELDIVEGVLKGRDAIRTRMANASARMAAAAADRPQRQSADLLSNVYVRVDGDSATARSRFTFLAEDEDGRFRVTGSGLYLDTWKREAGAWTIARRKVSWDLLAGQRAAATPARGPAN